MTLRAPIVAALAFAALAAPADAARVDLMVVGRAGVLREAAPVTLKRATIEVDGRRCRVPAATPLAALARTRLELQLRDYASCSGRPRDAAGLYVRGIEGEVERARSGWVYKIGRRAPSTGGGDTASRLRRRADVLWFWCRNGSGGCQRTLRARPHSRRVAAGSELRVTVVAYDDDGGGVPAAGATVTLGSASAQAGPDGVAVLTVPAGSATLSLVATAGGMVQSFPARVRVT